MTALLLLTAVSIGEAEEIPEEVRPVVRHHLESGRRLTAFSILLRYYEQNRREVPAKLRTDLAKAQADFLKGKGGEFETYRVKKNDSLWKIGRRYEVSAEFLKRVNRIKNPRRLTVGRRLKVAKGPFKAVLSVKGRALRVYLGEALVREYQTAVGAPETPTPIGEFKVVDKVVNPQYDKDGEHYGPGDPKNPAGTRWMRLDGAFGIHGTNEPESIGRAASDGCIRLHNEDVEELFDLLVTGSPVVIKP